MSTRSTTHFVYDGDKKPTAIIYRHSDGYPEGAGVDLLRFIEETGALRDSRWGDPSYLAAKYVVFLAREFADDPSSPLAFISVGVLDADPGDIEYRYVVRCGNGKPTVTRYAISGKYDGERNKYLPQSKWILTETPIPEPEGVKP